MNDKQQLQALKELKSEHFAQTHLIEQQAKRIIELEELPKKILREMKRERYLFNYRLYIEWADVEQIYKDNGVEL
jgi:hypothetical protein